MPVAPALRITPNLPAPSLAAHEDLLPFEQAFADAR